MEKYMREAIAEAKNAEALGEVPIGCVIADKSGAIIGRGSNRREQGDATAHAEIEAIRAACVKRGSWRLDDCAIYVTAEPCPMCAGAIINARIATVVYGAKEPRYGSCGSVINLFEENYGHRPRVYGGILAEECAALLSGFFERLR